MDGNEGLGRKRISVSRPAEKQRAQRLLAVALCVLTASTLEHDGMNSGGNDFHPVKNKRALTDRITSQGQSLMTNSI